jgi:hypothetical protein
MRIQESEAGSQNEEDLLSAYCLLPTAYCGTKQGVPLAAKGCKMTPAISVESGSPLIATFLGEKHVRSCEVACDQFALFRLSGLC